MKKNLIWIILIAGAGVAYYLYQKSKTAAALAPVNGINPTTGTPAGTTAQTGFAAAANQAATALNSITGTLSNLGFPSTP